MKTLQLYLFHSWDSLEIAITFFLLAVTLVCDWCLLKNKTTKFQIGRESLLLWGLGWSFLFLSLLLGTWAVVTPVSDFVNPEKALVIGINHQESTASRVGLTSGDRILQVNDNSVHSWSDIEDYFLHRDLSELDLLVQRRNESVAHKIRVVFSPSEPFAGIAASDLFIEEVDKDSDGQRAGLMSGDQILSIQGTPISSWDEVRDIVQKNTGVEVPIEIRRQGQIHQLTLKFSGNQRGWGVRSAVKIQRPSVELAREKNILQTFMQATTQALQWSVFSFRTLTKFSGDVFRSRLGIQNSWFAEASPRVYKGVQKMTFYLTLVGGILCALAPLLLLVEIAFIKMPKKTLLRVSMIGGCLLILFLSFFIEVASLDRYFII